MKRMLLPCDTPQLATGVMRLDVMMEGFQTIKDAARG